MIKLIFLAAIILVAQSKTPIPGSKLIKYLMPQPPPVPVVDASKSRSVVENFFDTPLNAFRDLTHETFQQRYFMNGEFFYPGGPLLIFLGGEWEVGPELLTPGVSVLMELAEELRGYAFYLEHRFFGESIPHQLDELTAFDMRFLSPSLALPDIAFFIDHIKQSHITPGAETSGVILVGAHYSGSLAVWFRQKFPHLVTGVWAAGAPLLSPNDNSEFKVLTGAVYRHVGGNVCYDRLDNGFQQLEQYIEDGNPEAIQDLFNLCEPIDPEHEEEVWAFFFIISEVFSVLAGNTEEDVLREICTLLSDPNVETDAHAVANVILPLLLDDPDSCFPFSYDWFIELDSDPSLNGTAVQTGLRQWSWTVCAALGWYHSSTSDNQPFGSSFPVDLLYAICEDLFGPTFNDTYVQRNILHTNIRYGGLNIKLPNVVYSHGFNDPWRATGMQEQLIDEAPVLITSGYSAYRELFAISDDDSLELIRTKQSIKGYIRRWLAESQNITVVPVDGNILIN